MSKTKWEIYKQGPNGGPPTTPTFEGTTDTDSIAFELDVGIYDVTAIVNVGEKSEYTIKKTGYVVILQQLFSVEVPDGTNKQALVSYNFGLDSSAGSGWSINEGENWVRPMTTDAVMTRSTGGEVVTLVWDWHVDKNLTTTITQWRLETEDNHSLPTHYLDKGQFEIETHVKTMDMRADLMSNRLTHQQTRFRISDVMNQDVTTKSKRIPLKVDAELWVNNDTPRLDISRNVNTDVEVTFKHSQEKIKDQETRQIGFKTNKSGYRIDIIEATFEIVSRFVRAGIDLNTYYAANPEQRPVEDIISNATVVWLSRDDYTKDACTGKLFSWRHKDIHGNRVGDPIYVDDSILIGGPDGRDDSMLVLSEDLVIDGSLGDYLFFVSGASMITMDIDGQKQSIHPGSHEIGNYKIYFEKTDPGKDITIPSGTHIFDLRVFDLPKINNKPIDVKKLDPVFQLYEEKLERFLPGV